MVIYTICIIVIYTICICIIKNIHKNCAVLRFYILCHIKENCVEFFFFICSLGGDYMIWLARMKFQFVQSGQILPYHHVWKLNFISARQDSFPPDICLALYASSLNFFLSMSIYKIENPQISIDLKIFCLSCLVFSCAYYSS